MGKKIKVMTLIGSMNMGGAQQIVMNYIRDFQCDPDIDFHLFVYSAPVGSKHDKEIEEKRYNVTYLNGPKTWVKLPYVRRYFQHKTAAKTWTRVIMDYNPDIVHTHITPIIRDTIDGIEKCCVPVRFHTLHSKPKRVNGKLKKIAIDAFNNKNVIPICITNQQSEEAKDWYGFNKFELIRNGIDIDNIHGLCCEKSTARRLFGIDQNAYVVLGVGRLNPIKNFPLLIKSTILLKKKRPETLLVIAGDGPERSKLEALVSSNGMREYVRFMGNVDNIIKLYCAADIVASTSFSEASPLVPVEAQICGIRCVVSNGSPEECIISKNSMRLNNDAGPEEWAEVLSGVDIYSTPILNETDFDVHRQSQYLKEMYIDYYKRAKK